MALIGCAPGKPGTVAPEASAVPTAAPTAVETAAPTAEPTAEPTAAPSAEPTAAPSASAAAEAPKMDPAPKALATKLPAGMTHVKGTMPKTGSVRKGAASCCGKGSCGACEAPKKSKRKGAKNCCGAGTCSPC